MEMQSKKEARRNTIAVITLVLFIAAVVLVFFAQHSPTGRMHEMPVPKNI